MSLGPPSRAVAVDKRAMSSWSCTGPFQSGPVIRAPLGISTCVKSRPLPKARRTNQACLGGSGFRLFFVGFFVVLVFGAPVGDAVAMKAKMPRHGRWTRFWLRDARHRSMAHDQVHQESE